MKFPGTLSQFSIGRPNDSPTPNSHQWSLKQNHSVNTFWGGAYKWIKPGKRESILALKKLHASPCKVNLRHSVDTHQEQGIL